MTRPRVLALVVAVLLGCAACDGSGPEASATRPPAAARSLPDRPTFTPMPTFDPSSRVGELAPGFPGAIVPVPAGSTIVASSATTEDGLTTVTLNLESNAPAKDLAAFYSAALTKQGFSSVPNKTASALTSMATYHRQEKGKAEETVVVGVFDDETSRLVTISGTVRG